MKNIPGCWIFMLILSHATFAQVDTTFIYRTNTPYGTLDIRLAKSATRYYYLQEDKTFSYRESSPGVRTGTYRDMTSWDSSPYKQGNLREKNGSFDYFIMNYRLLFPGNYTPAYTRGYPLIVMMHGAGERGNCWNSDCFWDTRAWNPNTNTPIAPTNPDHQLLNNDYNLLHGGSVHLQARNLAGSRLPDDPALPGRAFPGFVLFPQNLNGWDGGNIQDAIRLIRLLTKKYKIDPDRIYVHGLSNGGVATYDVIKRAPWLFAAALPMSAPTEAGITSAGLTPTVSHIPLWVFQGGLDTGPTPDRTRSYVRKFRDAGAVVRYTEYANLGHGVWNTAYDEPDFFSWMLDKNKADIHVFGGVTTICTNNGQGVRMELAEGFYHYQWERDGVVIAGAASAKYVATTPGTYRARFSRKKDPGDSDWNEWSDPVQVTTFTMPKAVISQTGSVVLRGLDGYPYAHLKAEGNFARYYWYKDGVLLNLPGAEDDTTRHIKLSAGDCSTGQCSGNGAYTLVVAGQDYCPGPASDAKHVFFNDQAPVNITAPIDFTGTALSDGSVSLRWNDVSTTENGFEIWRRRQTGATTFSKWEMAPMIAANATTMTDKGLYPSSTYQYKIRAVGNAGRSNYTPAASNQYLVVVTQGDTQNPTAPQNLTAKSTGIREIELRWTASTDNIGIKEYQIYYGSQVVATGSTATTHTLTNLPLNTNLTFTVRAKDLGDNLSAASNSASATTFVSGLFYEHSTGAFSDIDLINWNFAEYEGTVPNFTLAPRTQEDYFNFEFEGYLYITQPGSYQFQTYSDDGSRVTIDNTLAVDNDGRHGPRTITGPVLNLASGARLINVKYFDYNGGHTLVVGYKGPDTQNSWKTIPDAALRSGSDTPTLLAGKYGEVTAMTSDAGSTLEDRAMMVDVFPNPARPGENIRLQLPGMDQPVQVRILDMMGQTYFQHTFAKQLDQNEFVITPDKELSRGVYVVVVRQKNKVMRQTLVVKE